MKIRLKETPEQRELIQRLASNKAAESAEAAEALAQVFGPIIQKVLDQASTSAMIYRDWPYGKNEMPRLPIDLFYGKREGHFTVTMMTSRPGGLPRNHFTGYEEMLVDTYKLESQVDMDKSYAESGLANPINTVLNRLAQEFLLKQEREAHKVVLQALATANTETTDGTHQTHIISSNTAGRFQLHDLNQLFTRIRRINRNWAFGTPADGTGRLTDLIVSPEIMEDVRAFAYQPMNTLATPNTDESTAVPLPDSIRERVFNNAGMSEIYGVMLTEMLEYGVGGKYNDLFDVLYSGTPAFASATQEIIVGLDLSAEWSFVRPVLTDAGGGNVTMDTEEFSKRQKKVGWFGEIREGRVSLNSKSVAGIIT